MVVMVVMMMMVMAVTVMVAVMAAMMARYWQTASEGDKPTWGGGRCVCRQESTTSYPNFTLY